MKIQVIGAGGCDAELTVSAGGQPGSFLGLRGYGTEFSVPGQVIVASSVPSPISNSNLLMVRETTLRAETATALVSVNALLI